MIQIQQCNSSTIVYLFTVPPSKLPTLLPLFLKITSSPQIVWMTCESRFLEYREREKDISVEIDFLGNIWTCLQQTLRKGLQSLKVVKVELNYVWKVKGNIVLKVKVDNIFVCERGQYLYLWKWGCSVLKWKWLIFCLGCSKKLNNALKVNVIGVILRCTNFALCIVGHFA